MDLEIILREAGVTFLDLGLQDGDEVLASFKAKAVHVIGIKRVLSGLRP
jgi:hypothetical protein